MTRRVLTTKQRGYDSSHQQVRKQLLARWRPGDPCARCGLPMFGPPSKIDLGHTTDRTGYTGLEHASCNRSEGARRGNKTGPFKPGSAPAPRCAGCGQAYHHAGRTCEICGTHYHPSYGGGQRACSRACGVQLQRRNKIASGWIPPEQRPKPERVLREPKNGWPSTALAYYTCRYCGTLGVGRPTGQPREVCASRECQLARLAANNLRLRHGLTKQDADAHVSAVLSDGRSGRWSASRQW